MFKENTVMTISNLLLEPLISTLLKLFLPFNSGISRDSYRKLWNILNLSSQVSITKIIMIRCYDLAFKLEKGKGSYSFVKEAREFAQEIRCRSWNWIWWGDEEHGKCLEFEINY